MEIYLIQVLHNTGAFKRKRRPEETDWNTFMLGLTQNGQSWRNVIV